MRDNPWRVVAYLERESERRLAHWDRFPLRLSQVRPQPTHIVRIIPFASIVEDIFAPARGQFDLQALQSPREALYCGNFTKRRHRAGKIAARA